MTQPERSNSEPLCQKCFVRPAELTVEIQYRRSMNEGDFDSGWAPMCQPCFDELRQAAMENWRRWLDGGVKVE